MKKPMSAKKYSGKIFTKTFSQPKLNGMRCVINKNGAFSKNGNRVLSIKHITDELKQFFIANKKAVLDGEIYIHEEDFTKIIGLARRHETSHETRKLEFWCFDVIMKGCFADRIKWVASNINQFKNIKITRTTDISGKIELNRCFKAYIKNGYEGQIIRDGSAEYQHTRTKKMLKRKEFIDAEFKIVDIISGSAKKAKAVVLKTKKGSLFKASLPGSDGYLKELLDNKTRYIGGEATARYAALTKIGVPCGAVAEYIWDKKREV